MRDVVRSPVHQARVSMLRVVVLAAALLLTTMAVTPLATRAQADGVTLEEAYEYIRGVPGLKVGHMNVATDAVGDVGGADATWSASGKTVITKKLRQWLKALIESENGWGALPAKGDEALVVFVGLAEPPSLSGDRTVVLHTGLAGGGDLTAPDSQTDLASGVRLLDSSGLWFGDGRFFVQGGRSPVSDGSVAWFGAASTGGGGIVLPDGVLVAVVPLEEWSRHYRLLLESTTPTADPPEPPSRDVLYGPGGVLYQRLGERLDLSHVSCASSVVSELPGGRRTVELNVQALGPYSTDDLAGLKLELYDAAKGLIGTVDGAWTSIPDLGLYRGLFAVDDPAARSVAVAPPDGNKAAPTMSRLQRIGLANRTGLMGLDGNGLVFGKADCGRLTSDVELCGDAIIDAFVATGMYDEDSLFDATAGVARDGSITCDVSVDGRPAARLVQGVRPATSGRAVEAIAEASGCAVTGAPQLDGAVVSCDELVVWLWRQAIPALGWVDVDGGVGAIQSILLYRPIYRGLPGVGDEPADSQLPQAMAPVSDAMAAALEPASFELVVPRIVEAG